MDSITFKNFRKFKEETTFELNNINILVGPNNSGKSTLTKGLRLYLWNILNLRVNGDNLFSIRPFFQFGGDVLDNPHVGTFGRALSKDADSNDIVFSARFFNTIIDTNVSRYSKHLKDAEGNPIDYYNSTSAPITKICLFNTDFDTMYFFDFEKECFQVCFNFKGISNYFEIWKDRLEGYKNERKKHKFSSEVELLDDYYHKLENCLSFGIQDRLLITTKLVPNVYTGRLYGGLIYYARNLFVDIKNDKCDYVVNEKDEHLLNNEYFSDYYIQINNDISDDFDTYVENLHSIVIEAHSVTHSLVYNISDKNDYMAQTILDYISQDIKDSDPEKLFIEDWMTKFNIGEDFVIESFGGECFKFEIIEDVDCPERRTPLLDKGVGSNQIMILLLRLATIMRQNRGTTIPCTVIIEEPEQNLHPKLQSLLADLFNEVYQYPMKENKDSWGISFLVETHSEYLVRKSQVIVSKQQDDTEAPFTVYYLGENEQPQKMIYQENGTFQNDFGEGFYNESIKLTEEIV